MPRTLITAAVLLAAATAACAPKDDTTPQETTSMSADSVRAMAERYTAAWGSQDPASVASHFAEEGSLKINDGAPAVGRAAITESARGFMTAFPDMVVTMDSLVARGERWEYHWTLTGTNTGPNGTGNVVRISGYENWLLAPDGTIRESLGHFDEVEYERQLREGPTRRA